MVCLNVSILSLILLSASALDPLPRFRGVKSLLLLSVNRGSILAYSNRIVRVIAKI